MIERWILNLGWFLQSIDQYQLRIAWGLNSRDVEVDDLRGDPAVDKQDHPVMSQGLETPWDLANLALEVTKQNLLF